MSESENAALVRRVMEEGFNGANFAVMDELFKPDYVRHEAGGVRLNSLDEHKADLVARLQAFPDSRFEIQQVIAGGDEVAVRYYITGTHTGEYRGAAPTGQHVTRACTAFFHIENGQIAEGWLVLGRAGSFWT